MTHTILTWPKGKTFINNLLDQCCNEIEGGATLVAKVEPLDQETFLLRWGSITVAVDAELKSYFLDAVQKNCIPTRVR